MLEAEFKKDAARIDDFLREYCQDLRKRMPMPAERLFEAMQYSLFNGGKRFRPILSLFTAQALNVDLTRILPFAAAVEMIHTYSLIHDDLPSMDNDKVRRGQPTNHMVYGEDIALLAGDALLTEAFYLIATSFKKYPEIGMELTFLLTEAAGNTGMIPGQVIDLSAANKSLEVAELEEMHRLKTGALIRVSVEGVAVIARLPDEERKRLRKFGEDLGRAFQLADDIQDYVPENPEKSGLPARIGVDKTRAMLEEISDSALLIAESIGSTKNHLLSSLVKYNLNRAE